MKIPINHHARLPARGEKSLPFIVMLFLFVLSAVTDAADIRQLPYRYGYELAQDAGESASVVCDDCPVRVPLRLSFKRHVMPPLAARVSEDIPDRQASSQKIGAASVKGVCRSVSKKLSFLDRKTNVISHITPPLKSDTCKEGIDNEHNTEKERR